MKKNLRLLWLVVLLTAINLMLAVYGHHLRAQAIAENAEATAMYKRVIDTAEEAHKAMTSLWTTDNKLKASADELEAANAKLQDANQRLMRACGSRQIAAAGRP